MLPTCGRDQLPLPEVRDKLGSSFGHIGCIFDVDHVTLPGNLRFVDLDDACRRPIQTQPVDLGLDILWSPGG
jgi:hypothetical protein